MDPAAIGNMVAVLLTILSFSGVLYKETPFFRFAEYTFIGVSAGYVLALGVKSILDNAWAPIVKGNYMYAIPIVLGFVLYTRFHKGTAYLSNWSTAFIVGVGAALAIRANIHANFLTQILGTMLPIVAKDAMTSLNNIVIIVGVAASMLYFTFTREHKGTFGYATKIGRIVIMVAFGSIFAGIILTRLTLIAGRIRFLLQMFGLLPA
jgi:hypothetical protein